MNRSSLAGGQDLWPPKGAAWPASAVPAVPPCKDPARPAAHQYSPAPPAIAVRRVREPAGPLRHVPASRVLGLLQGLRPIPCLRPTTGLSRPSSWTLEGGSDTKRFPCSTRNRLISLAPSFAPAASPQLRRSPSSWPSRRHAKPATKSAAPTQSRNGRALHPGPYPPDLSRRLAYGALTTGSCRIPSDLARRTQLVWQYQAVPALSALLPTLPVVSRIRLRSASIGLLRQPDEKVFHLLQLRAPHGAQAPRGARCCT